MSPALPCPALPFPDLPRPKVIFVASATSAPIHRRAYLYCCILDPDLDKLKLPSPSYVLYCISGTWYWTLTILAYTWGMLFLGLGPDPVCTGVLAERASRVASVLTIYVCPIITPYKQAEMHEIPRHRTRHAKQKERRSRERDYELDGLSHLIHLVRVFRIQSTVPLNCVLIMVRNRRFISL